MHPQLVSNIAIVSKAQLKEAFASALLPEFLPSALLGLVLKIRRMKQTLIAGLISDSENNNSYSWPPSSWHHGTNGNLMNIVFL